MVCLEKREKYDFVCVKLRRETYQELIRTKALYELQLGRRLSMDSLVRLILDSLPRLEVKFPEELVRLTSGEQREGQRRRRTSSSGAP